MKYLPFVTGRLQKHPQSRDKGQPYQNGSDNSVVEKRE